MGRSIVFLAVIFLLSGCGTGRFEKSKVIFTDTYRLEGADNMEFIFSKDSTLVVRQKGIYEFGKNEAGEPIVRICLDDISRELPEDYNFTEYLMKEAKDHVMLTYTSKEFNLDANPMKLYLLEGKDGLMSGKYFDGTYQIGADGDSYQYVFESDGSIAMRVEEHYYADQGEMTLSDYAGSTKYQYEFLDDVFILKNRKGETILTLQKKAATDQNK